MSLKLKILGMSLLAVMATSAFAVMNAAANKTGHFTHDGSNGHAIVIGSENGIHSAHSLSFQRTVTENGQKVFSGAAVVCNHATYEGTVSEATTQTLRVVPSYTECETTRANPEDPKVAVDVTTNGCSYVFHSNTNASTHTPTEKATVTVDCPVGKAIEIHHPNCTNTVGTQLLSGVTYTTVTEGTKHAITARITVKGIVGQFHGGICIFLGTTQEFDMNGSVTVKGFDTESKQINITAT